MSSTRSQGRISIYLSIYIYKYSICPLTCNAVRFMLCWFTGVFGILLVLACFGLLFHFLMLSMQFLLLASHFHFPSVLDLCVIFLLLPNLSLRSFFNDKIAHICGAVAFIPGGLLSSCAAMHAAFPRLLHASAFSLLPLCKDTTKGSTMCTANKNKPACSDPWRSDSQACSVPKALQHPSTKISGNEEMTACR